jgi:tetratricopeptide (TPR) repeat protein
MSTEPKAKDTEQNALASRLSNFWTDFKQGKVLSYKMMAILLIVVAVLGTWWYISRESKKATSQQWMDLDEASTQTRLEELIKKDPKAVTARVAELDLARPLLGREGLDLLFGSPADLRARKLDAREARELGVANIEKAREAYAKWLEKSKTDSVFKNDLNTRAECLWALGRAEEALVGVPVAQTAPTGDGPVAPTDQRRGDVNKAIEYFDQLVELAAVNPKIAIPWAEEAKKRAETMRKDPETFKRISRSVFEPISSSSTTDSHPPVPPPPTPPKP